MFDEYAKKLKELGEDVPKIFKKVAKKGAIKFVNEAKDRTDREKLVKTGAYKRTWQGKVIEQLNLGEPTYIVECTNNMEYSSYLESGHELRNGVWWNGRFIGELSRNEAQYYCVQEFEKALEKAMKKK